MSEDKNPNPYRRATAVAASVIGMGLLASVAGNFQSIILDTPDGAWPSVGSMISAVWWPALLFAMIELAIHTPWGNTRMWRAIQWMGAGVIGGLAFYISYFHLAHVLSSYGYDVVSRYAGPVTVDVAMMVATLAMHRIGVAKRTPVATVAEVASVATPEPVATGQTEVASVATPEPEPSVASRDEVATEPADVLAALDEDWGNLEAELEAEVQATPPPAAAKAKPTAPVKVTAAAAEHIRAAREADPLATAVAIARTLMAAGLVNSEKTGRRYVAAMKDGTARVS